MSIWKRLKLAWWRLKNRFKRKTTDPYFYD